MGPLYVATAMLWQVVEHATESHGLAPEAVRSSQLAPPSEENQMLTFIATAAIAMPSALMATHLHRRLPGAVCAVHVVPVSLLVQILVPLTSVTIMRPLLLQATALHAHTPCHLTRADHVDPPSKET